MPDFVKGLLRPEVYPHPVAEIKLVQTHISYVFITGDFVYKIKKPVNFGFLDFTTLEKRKHFCEREVVLNKRLSPEIYLGVEPVTTDGKRFFINGPGEVIEYAVKMRQMPQYRMMDVLIKDNKIDQRIIDRIVQKLVPFYAQAATGPEIDFYGEIPQVRFNIEENFAQTEGYIGRALTRERFETIKSYSLSFFEKKVDLFQERIKSGKIRDGHGDLYSANICIADDVYIYDCIEFNERFRYGDVACDIAFLAMDLDFHRLGDLSGYFIDRFVELSGDRSLIDVLDFYKCYRAYVRGKIHSFSADSKEIGEEDRGRSLSTARKYFALAYRYAGGKRKPVLLVFFGLIAGGKSTMAKVLGKKLNIVPLNSDEIRKKMAGLAPTERRLEPFGQGIYNADFSRSTYTRLREEAAARLEMGESVILDASYKDRAERMALIQMAEELDIPYCFVYCHCPEEETKARLERRRKNRKAVSDGRWEIYMKQVETFDRPEEIPAGRLLQVDTSQTVARTTAYILQSCPEDIRQQKSKTNNTLS